MDNEKKNDVSNMHRDLSGVQPEAGYSDAGYIPQGEAPALHFSRFGSASAQEKKSENKPGKSTRRGIPTGTVIALCLICALLGGAAQSLFLRKTPTQESLPEPVQETQTPPPADAAAAVMAVAPPAQTGERAPKALLGISGETVSESVARYYGMAQGVYVWTVAAGSGAEKAGVRPGDIITALDGKTVTGTGDLHILERGCRAGDECSLTVRRNGEDTSLTVVFDEEKD